MTDDRRLQVETALSTALEQISERDAEAATRLLWPTLDAFIKDPAFAREHADLLELLVTIAGVCAALHRVRVRDSRDTDSVLLFTQAARLRLRVMSEGGGS